MDYVFFAYGLSFFLLAAACVRLRRRGIGILIQPVDIPGRLLYYSVTATDLQGR
jgi:hypothetical protein